MTKRKHVDDADIPSDEASGDECEITAKSLVANQKEQQMKRRSSASTPGRKARTSVWTTVAAVQVEIGSTEFVCKICEGKVNTNQDFSSSNITAHYRKAHKEAHNDLSRLNKQGANDQMLRNVIVGARKVMRRPVQGANIKAFFRSPGDSSLPRAQQRQQKQPAPVQTQVPLKTLQAVATVLYTCVTETSILKVASPITQGFVDMFGGRMLFSSKETFESFLIPTYKSICRFLRREATSASVGCITLDGWSAALGSPVLGVTWHFVDDDWRLRCIPISALNTGTASKSGEQLRCIVNEIMSESEIIGSDAIRIHTVTSDNEASVKLACDLLTNYVGSVRCVVHTLALCVNGVFEAGKPWQNYLNHVNKVTKYFNYHSKAAILLKQKQIDSGVTNDRLHRLKHDIPTRWHSRLGAMLTYITEYDNILKVVTELNISESEVPLLNQAERDTFAEIITVLAEFRRVARQLEADRKVTMSRAPRLLHELYETLCVVSGDMSVCSSSFYEDTTGSSTISVNVDDTLSTSKSIPSVAEHCSMRDELRALQFRTRAARDLARDLAEKVRDRFGILWEPVTEGALMWSPTESEEPCTELRPYRRVLLFHIAAVMDVNECELEFLSVSKCDRESYIQGLHKAVAREALELGDTGKLNFNQLVTTFGMLHDEMREVLKTSGRREAKYALLYWKGINETTSYSSPKAFNRLAGAALASQASSASSERLFSDLGMLEGRERQSMLSDTLHVTETIRAFCKGNLERNELPQTGTLHPQGAAFKRIATKIAGDVVKNAS